MIDDPSNPAPGESPRPEPQPAPPRDPLGNYGGPPPPPPPPAPYGQYGSAPSGAPLPPRYQRGEAGTPRAGGSCLRTLGIIFAVLLVLGGLLVVIGLFSALGIGRSKSGGIGFGDKIGLVRVEGIISQSEDKRFWMQSIKDLGENSRVKGVVVRIDSPGGTVGASQELYDAVIKLRDRYRKPVYVSMGDLAASGGYYMASAANKIFANRGTLTGSIGVILSKPQISDLIKKIGYQTDVIKSGRFKDAGSITRPMTEPERVMFNFLINDAYQQFLHDVLRFRAKRLEQALLHFPADKWTAYQFTKPAQPSADTFLREIADGRVYSGEQAHELGLVDEIGSLDDTVEALAKEVHLLGKPEILETTRKPTLRELLKNKVDQVLPSSQANLQYMMVLP